MPTGRWIDALPASWGPYLELSRLHSPVGFLIIFFPHCFGVLHAARGHALAAAAVAAKGGDVARVGLVLLVGSLLANNASHTWNDVVDAPVDRRVARTRGRPVARGAVTPSAAVGFAASQAAAAALLLLLLPAAAVPAALPTVVGTLYYPFAKRHLPCPQLVLGVCLAGGILVGSAAMGAPAPWADASTVLLALATVLGAVVCDTVYAHQDLADDRKIGVHSTAILFGRHTRPILWVLLLGMSGALAISGYIAGAGLPYFVLAVGGCLASVGCMIANVDLSDPSSCWAWLSTECWTTGGAISTGLLVEYLLSG